MEVDTEIHLVLHVIYEVICTENIQDMLIKHNSKMQEFQ